MTDKFAEEWIALWQSELTAMAADRELQETVTAMLALWASTATATVNILQMPYEPARRDAKTLQPARPPAAAAAFEPGMDEVAGLHRRIAELEQRLAGLEPGGRPKKLEPGGRPKKLEPGARSKKLEPGRERDA
jgi:hypothetical protein